MAFVGSPVVDRGNGISDPITGSMNINFVGSLHFYHHLYLPPSLHFHPTIITIFLSLSFYRFISIAQYLLRIRDHRLPIITLISLYLYRIRSITTIQAQYFQSNCSYIVLCTRVLQPLLSRTTLLAVTSLQHLLFRTTLTAVTSLQHLLFRTTLAAVTSLQYLLFRTTLVAVMSLQHLLFRTTSTQFI